MSEIFRDGFEAGLNWTKGANGSGALYELTTNPAEVHSGQQAAKLTAGPERWRYTGMTAQTITYQADGTYTMKMPFLLKQNLNISVECSLFFYDGTKRWQPLIHWINEYGASKLGYLDATNTWVQVASGINIPINEYHILELVANFATKTIVEIRLDGVVYPVNALMASVASTASPKITPDLAVWSQAASLVSACIDDVSVELGVAPPPTQFTLMYQSNPIVVPCTVNGQTLNPGGSIQVPSGTSVTISAPLEVTA